MSGQPPPFQTPSRRQLPLALRLLLFCFLSGIAIIPVAAGAILYVALSGTFSDTTLGNLGRLGGPGGWRLPDGRVTDAPQSPAVKAPPVEPPGVDVPEWSSRGRINVLLLGNDRRTGETDIPRTDTIIVLTIDPDGHTAGLLSLPRDLWVPIPGHGTDRINAAYEIGESEKRDGGPELTRKTVEQLIGMPIHHYVVVGFAGFQRMVDEVGGVTIDVDRPIKDDEYPDVNYSMRRIFFQPGIQHMSGETALWYVRTRHADSDFGRARRQQQFLVALRKQALQVNLLPKAPALLSALADTFKTDFKPREIISLAGLSRDIDTSKLTNRVIDETMTTHWVTPAGAQVEIPDRQAVRRVVQEVFGKPA